MTEPRRLTDEDMEHATLSRRIPVDEYRDDLQNPDGTVGGWRLRLVDHATESLVNMSTRCKQKLNADGIDNFMCVIITLVYWCLNSAMFKGEVSSAFRSKSDQTRAPPTCWNCIHG